MPQLLPRTDSVGWVTPALSQIIETAPLEAIEPQQKPEQINLFRARLAQFGVNAQVMDILVMPSHLRYYLRPAGESIAANNYEVFINQLRQAIPDIKRLLAATSAEVMISPKKPLIVQLLVRSANHTTLQLGHLLRLRPFIDTASTLSVPFGLDVDSEPYIQNIQDLQTLLVVGDATTRYHFIATMLITLSVFNTPLEMRYALIGQDVDPFNQLSQTPHVLGGTLTTIRELSRLLDGLEKHLGQRKQQFAKFGVNTLDAYNDTLDKDLHKPFPRLVIVIDTIPFEDQWTAQRESWFSALYRIIKDGPSVGIYTILTASTLDGETVPPRLLSLFKQQMLLRPAINKTDLKSPFPILPSPFVEAVLINGKDEPIQLELPEVEDRTLTNLIKYWRQSTAKRSMEALAQGRKRSSGDTGLLTLRQDARLKIAKMAQNTPRDLDPQPAVEVAEAADETHLRRSRALAAYLGWLGLGPLIDVLEISLEDAQSTINSLQNEGLLEEGSGPVWRYRRLDK